MKTLTLVIPCYNEEDALPPLFARLAQVKKALGDAAELDLLFVDDGSRDRTPEILEAIPAELQPARAVTHETNKNLGGAIRTGFSEAQGEFVATMDADCTYDPMYLVEMTRLAEPGVDVVTGSEFHPRGRIDNVSWIRLIPSRSLSRIYRAVFWSDLYSFSCLLRIYRRTILPDIMPQSPGFLSCTEVLIRAMQHGYDIVEYPLVLTEREHGETKMPFVSTTFAHLGFIFSHLLRRRPSRTVAPGGM